MPARTRNSRQVPPAIFDGITKEIEAALDGRVKAQWLLERSLAAPQIRSALAEAHSLPVAHYDGNEQEAYDRSLEYLSQILARLAPELPDYARERDTEVLRRFDILSASITGLGAELASRLRAVDDLHRWRAEERDGTASKIDRFTEVYRRTLTERLDYVELLGVDVHRRARRAKLSVAYIELDVDLESGEDGAETASQGCERLLDELAPASRCLLVVGEAGSGKSTFLRWTALTAAEFRSEPEMLAELSMPGFRRWRERIPLLIFLRDLRSADLPAPAHWPGLIDESLGTQMPEGWAESVLNNDRALVMIDGLDEVPPDQRDTVMGSIEQLTRRYPTAFFILTSRPAAVDEAHIAAIGFRQARIAALTDVNRDRFIDHWHEGLRRNLLTEEAELDTVAMARKLRQALRHNRALALLASNPLLCAAICALHHFHDTDEAELPDRLAPLCEEICKCCCIAASVQHSSAG